MKLNSIVAVAHFLVTLLFSLGSAAQSVYPPILADSATLAIKKNYLSHLTKQNVDPAGPNIIIILVDDLGKNDISLYTDDGVKTPNINTLASEGVVFTEAYATSAVCNPSRASLVTGRYPQRFGNELQIMNRYAKSRLELFIYKNFINTKPMHLKYPWYSPPQEEMQKQGLPESEISLFEVLQAAGYRTACIGKWHLGYNEPFLPENKGIDEFYGFYEAYSLYAPKWNMNMVNYKHRIFQNKHIWRQKRKGPAAIIQNGEEIKEKEYLTDRIAEEACHFIKNNENTPFLLYVPFSAPHTPFQAPKSYYNKFPHIKDKNKRVYYAMIAALDDAIGEILGQVEASDIEENTLIFLASDNGGATYTGATDNGDLKGGKITHFEGGLNVPFIMKWEGKIPAGKRYQDPVSLMDIFTTSVAASNVPFPSEHTLDGVDLLPYLLGERSHPPHEYLFWRTEFNKTIRNGRWKLIQNARDDLLLLYDIEADKQELFNLKDHHPEIIDHLLIQLEDWETGLIPPSWPGVMEYEEVIDGVKMRFAF